jgi:hypothetical protein
MLERFSIVRRIAECADFDWAMEIRNLKYLKYLHERGLWSRLYKESSLIRCIENNDLPTLKYCHENVESLQNYDKFGKIAAREGHLGVVKYFDFIGCKFDTWAMDRAARYNHLEVVKWLHENRHEGCTMLAMDRAAENGHLELVKWLHTNRKEGCSVYAVNEAACNGHLDVVKWFYYISNERCDPAAIQQASLNGHYELVEFLESFSKV